MYITYKMKYIQKNNLLTKSVLSFCFLLQNCCFFHILIKMNYNQSNQLNNQLIENKSVEIPYEFNEKTKKSKKVIMTYITINIV